MSGGKSCDCESDKHIKITVNSDGSYEIENDFESAGIYPLQYVEIEKNGDQIIVKGVSTRHPGNFNTDNPQYLSVESRIYGDGIVSPADITSSYAQWYGYGESVKGDMANDISRLQEICAEDLSAFLSAAYNEYGRSCINTITCRIDEYFLSQVRAAIDAGLLNSSCSIRVPSIELNDPDIDDVTMDAVQSTPGLSLMFDSVVYNGNGCGITMRVSGSENIEYSESSLFPSQSKMNVTPEMVSEIRGISKQTCLAHKGFLDGGISGTSLELLDFMPPQQIVNEASNLQDEPFTLFEKLQAIAMDSESGCTMCGDVVIPYGRYGADSSFFEFSEMFHHAETDENGKVVTKVIDGYQNYFYEAGCIALLAKCVGGIKIDMDSASLRDDAARIVSVIAKMMNMSGIDLVSSSDDIVVTGGTVNFVRKSIEGHFLFSSGGEDTQDYPTLMSVVSALGSVGDSAFGVVWPIPFWSKEGGHHLLVLDDIPFFDSITAPNLDYFEDSLIMSKIKRITITYSLRTEKAMEWVEKYPSLERVVYRRGDESLDTTLQRDYYSTTNTEYEYGVLASVNTWNTPHGEYTSGSLLLKGSPDFGVWIDLCAVVNTQGVSSIDTSGLPDSTDYDRKRVANFIELVTRTYGKLANVEMKIGDTPIGSYPQKYVDAVWLNGANLVGDGFDATDKIIKEMDKHPLTYGSYGVDPSDVIFASTSYFGTPSDIVNGYGSVLNYVREHYSHGASDPLSSLLTANPYFWDGTFYVDVVITGERNGDRNIWTATRLEIGNTFNDPASLSLGCVTGEKMVTLLTVEVSNASPAFTDSGSGITLGWSKTYSTDEDGNCSAGGQTVIPPAQMDKGMRVEYTLSAPDADGAVTISYVAYDENDNDITDQIKTLTLGDYFLYRED